MMAFLHLPLEVLLAVLALAVVSTHQDYNESIVQ
jgi:hypothetical protein